MQTSFLKLAFEALPDGDREIFGGRNTLEKLRNLLVKEAVIHRVENFVVHDFLQLLQIHNEPGARINLALHRDFERVVVSVAVGVITFAEDALVLFGREVGIMVEVRGGEFGFAG